MKTNKSLLIVMTPKNVESSREEILIRFDDKSDEFLDGYITALEEVMENYNIYTEEV